MKIMYIINGFGLSDRVSGSAVRSIEIAKRLQEKGHTVYFLTTIGGFKACKREGLNVNYHILPASLLRKRERGLFDRFLSYLVSTFAYALRISRLPRVEIIYTDSDYFCDTAPAVLYKRKFKSAKWVASIYHFIPSPSKRPGGIKFSNVLSYVGQQLSLKMVAKGADLVNTETNFLKHELVKRYQISPEKIIVVQSGINPKIINKVPWKSGKIYDACFLGGLRRSKGIFDLINAWGYMCKHVKNAKLAIAGSSSAEIIAKLKYEVKKLGLENNIDLLGFLSEEEKYRVLKASRVYVLPSYEEGIPITFYEAMYCGLPIVTYYLPSYVDIKDYIVKVPLGNVRGLSKIITEVLANETLMTKLGAEGKKLAKEHEWSKVAYYMCSQMESLIKS